MYFFSYKNPPQKKTSRKQEHAEVESSRQYHTEQWRIFKLERIFLKSSLKTFLKVMFWKIFIIVGWVGCWIAKCFRTSFSFAIKFLRATRTLFVKRAHIFLSLDATDQPTNLCIINTSVNKLIQKRTTQR